MRMRKKKNLTPRMEACQEYWIRDPFEMKDNWLSLKPDAKELHVELGCGKGRFTVETAKQNPEILFVAVEKVPDAMVIAMERAKIENIKNVYFVVGDAFLLPDMFNESEVSRIYINFCDPWPKSNQKKKRLTHGRFLTEYRKVLSLDGEIHFKSDNDALFEWSLEEIPNFGFELSQVTHDLHKDGPNGVMTDYEAKFYSEGKNINRCVARMIPLIEAE